MGDDEVVIGFIDITKGGFVDLDNQIEDIELQPTDLLIYVNYEIILKDGDIFDMYIPLCIVRDGKVIRLFYEEGDHKRTQFFMVDKENRYVDITEKVENGF